MNRAQPNLCHSLLTSHPLHHARAMQITSALLTQMGNQQWKDRKAAMDEVERMLQAAAFRIQPEVGHGAGFIWLPGSASPFAPL